MIKTLCLNNINIKKILRKMLGDDFRDKLKKKLIENPNT